MNRKLVIYISIAFAAIALIGGIIVLVVVGTMHHTDDASATPDQATAESVTTAVPSETAAAPATAATDPAITPATSYGTEAPEPETTAETETASASEETQTAVSAPDQLTELLAANGTTPQEMFDNGCTQLVVVRADGSSAAIDCYHVVEREWVLIEDMTCTGYVGSNGVTTDMHEGGLASPIGLYSIGDAFYINEMPETGLSTFQITSDTYWVDDPDSRFYNQRVEGVENMDWDSAEHMIDYYSAYEFGFVINYNTEALYNKGSAIFFHVSSGPTAGCIGTSREMVLRYLRELDASQNPYILIE